jgi:hypothetical protein
MIMEEVVASSACYYREEGFTVVKKRKGRRKHFVPTKHRNPSSVTPKVELESIDVPLLLQSFEVCRSVLLIKRL